MFTLKGTTNWKSRLKTVLPLVMAVTCVLWTMPCAGAESDPAVAFKFAFGSVAGQGDQAKLAAVGRDAVLKSGDRLKMMVEMKRKSFVYVFHSSDRDGLKLLFPYSFEQFTTDYQPSVKYYIPRGEAWFELDNQPGRENFYMLASVERLSDLEELYKKYEAADAQSKPDLMRKVLDKIRDLRKQNRELAAPAERPVAIGGAVRGIKRDLKSAQPDVATVADEITSSGFVSRTYTIEHK